MSNAREHLPLLSTASTDEQAALARDGLYDAARERDACGLGFVAPVQEALEALPVLRQPFELLESAKSIGLF